MIDPNLWGEIFAFMASAGLSLSAGVRAYIPLLALGVAADQHAFGIKLRPEFAFVGDWWFIGLLAVLTVYEISADKIPVVDHLNDVVHTVIRPLSGALIFTATSNPLSNSGMTGAIIAAVIGGALAGTTHTAKAVVVRPATTVTTAGLGNPIVSVIEDVFVIGTTLLALFVPVLGVVIFLLMIFVLVRALRTLAARRRNRSGGQPALSGVPPTVPLAGAPPPYGRR